MRDKRAQARRLLAVADDPADVEVLSSEEIARALIGMADRAIFYDAPRVGHEEGMLATERRGFRLAKTGLQLLEEENRGIPAHA